MLPLASRTSGGGEDGDLIDPGFLVQSSLVSLHSPQSAPKQGSSHSGTPRKDVQPLGSDSPWVQTGKNKQRKHHLFQKQVWNHFAQAKRLISDTLSTWQKKKPKTWYYFSHIDALRLVPAAEHRTV